MLRRVVVVVAVVPVKLGARRQCRKIISGGGVGAVGVRVVVVVPV